MIPPETLDRLFALHAANFMAVELARSVSPLALVVCGFWNMGTTGVLTMEAQLPPPGSPKGEVKSSEILGVPTFWGCTRGDLMLCETVGVDVCQLVKSALRGRIFVATGVSVEVIGQASFAA
jgi:hypothetical protein